MTVRAAATARSSAVKPAKPPSLAELKTFVADVLKLGPRSFRTFEKYAVAKRSLPTAGQKQYDKFEREFPKTGQGPQARKLRIGGATVFMATAYNWPYELYRFVLYDVHGKELARGAGTQGTLKWSPAK